MIGMVVGVELPDQEDITARTRKNLAPPDKAYAGAQGYPEPARSAGGGL